MFTALIRVFYISKRILTIKMFRAVCAEKRSHTVLREFDISITWVNFACILKFMR